MVIGPDFYQMYGGQKTENDLIKFMVIKII